MDLAYLIDQDSRCECCSIEYKLPNKPYCLKCKDQYIITCKVCQKNIFDHLFLCEHLFFDSNVFPDDKIYGTGAQTNLKLVKRWSIDFFMNNKHYFNFEQLPNFKGFYGNNNFIQWCQTLDENTKKESLFLDNLIQKFKNDLKNQKSWIYFQSYKWALKFHQYKIKIENPTLIGYYVNNENRKHFHQNEYLYCFDDMQEISKKRIPKSDLIPAYHFSDLEKLGCHNYLSLDLNLDLNYEVNDYFNSILSFKPKKEKIKDSIFDFLDLGKSYHEKYSDLLSIIISYNYHRK